MRSCSLKTALASLVATLAALATFATFVATFASVASEGEPDALPTAPEAIAASVDRRMADLLAGDPERSGAALSAIGESRDARYVAPLVELLRAIEIGLIPDVPIRQVVRTLEQLTGESLGPSWPAWFRFVTRSSAATPRGFTGWKGTLLSRIDARFGALLAHGIPLRIRSEEIVWGGVAYEGIPALDAPATLPAVEAEYLADSDAVIGIAIEGDARAYPLRILDWHEMANDRIAGRPVTLAYCTLCGSGIAFDARAPDGSALDFGSSGLLMRSNKLMVDRQTHSLWNHLTGEPVVGPHAAEPFRLGVIPSVLTTWKQWRTRYPKTRVLSLATGHDRPYTAGAAYGDYFASSQTMFPVAEAGAPKLAAKERIYGLAFGGHAKAYPLPALRRARVVNDRVGDLAVVLLAEPRDVEVHGRSVRTGARLRYSAGSAVRSYERGARKFVSGALEDELLDEQGRRWRIGEDALLGPGDEQLARVPGTLAYGFAWAAFHPASEVWP